MSARSIGDHAWPCPDAEITVDPTRPQPTASIVIPTFRAGDYLDVTLASIVDQAKIAGAEVIVVSDGPDPTTAATAHHHGVRLVTLPEHAGLNTARNAGIDAAGSDLIVFTDQDVAAPAGWLDAWIDGAARYPELEVFGGPIRARLEGGLRACGRESAPITTLDAGPTDRDVPIVWGANMMMRRSAFERVGRFNPALLGRGDEEEWLLRYTARGGRIRYLAAATIDHRRTAADSRLRVLARAAYGQGVESRRHDRRMGDARSIPSELRVLAGCAWHTVRRRCAYGIVMGARTAGTLREALTELWAPGHDGPDGGISPASGSEPVADFLSGASGEVSGIRATTRAIVVDGVADARDIARARPWRLRRAAQRWPRRRVLALAVERTDAPNVLPLARRELLRSRHDVQFDSTPVAGLGKFENLNLLLARNSLAEHDWLLVIDDDVWLPTGFLDSFVFLIERFGLRLAQPAHRARSHAAWEITRRRPGSLIRQTAYVEIGPVVAFHATTFATLLPFPELHTGWGLDAHWAAVARQHGWPMGVVDATPIRHGLRKIASAYDRERAIAEGRRFLADRPYLPAREHQQTLAERRSWR